MDWLRRNWPDLLIGVALLLVVAGIIMTLLNGGSFFPFGQQNQPNLLSNTPPVVSPSANTDSPSANSTSANGVAVPTTAPVVDVVPTDSVDPSAAGQDGATASGDTENTDASQSAEIIPVLPAVSNQNGASQDNGSVASATPVTNSNGSTIAVGSSAAPYRIRLGSFSTEENAQRKAAEFADQGYPVFVGRQGAYYVAVVGPYDNLADAERSSQAIKVSVPDAVLYELDASGEASTVASDSNAITTPAVSDAPVANADAVVPVSSSGSFFQVGAYATTESAQPQRERLQQLGFQVSQIQEGSLIKLLVGPYDSANVATVKAQLDAQGIESFVR